MLGVSWFFQSDFLRSGLLITKSCRAARAVQLLLGFPSIDPRRHK